MRRSPQDVLSAPPWRLQGADREVREARHGGRRPGQHRGKRGDAQRHAGAPGDHYHHHHCHYYHHCYLQTGKHLGIRISGSCPEPGIFIVEILEDSITALDGRIRAYDRLLSINGTDVRHCKISQASDLIKVSSSYQGAESKQIRNLATLIYRSKIFKSSWKTLKIFFFTCLSAGII